MAEYIERETALLAIMQEGCKASHVKAIRSIPTADVVEVVRCKDCEYYNEDCMSPHTGWCEHFERGEFDNHYCYGADRRKHDGA